MGESTHLYPRRSATIIAVRIRVMSSYTLLYGFRRPFDHLKRLGDFLLQRPKICGQERTLGINHYVSRDLGRKPIQPDCFTKAAPHAIALHCPSERSTHSKAYSKSFPAILTAKIKHRHMRCKMAASVLINAFKIRMF